MKTQMPLLVGMYTLPVRRNRIRIPDEWRHAFFKGEAVFLFPPASSQCNTGYWLAGARFLQVLSGLSLAC